MSDTARAEHHTNAIQRVALDGEDAMAILSSEDPQPAYARMAAECPFAHNADGSVTAFRMADIQSLARSHDVLGNGGLGPSMGGTRPLKPLDLDGPEHTKFRRLLDPLFAPRRIALLEPRVRTLANELIDGFADRGRVDIFEAYCEPLPSTIFLGIMGIPQSDLSFFLSFKRGILKHDRSQPVEQIMATISAASDQCYAYFNRVLDEREQRDNPGDDLLGWFLTAEVDGHRLSREDTLDVVYLLMIAGLDTVAASLANIITWLARHPDRRQEILDDPSLWPAVVEELMRFTSPVSTGYRYPQVAMTVGGESLTPGQQVIVSWAAANLDPDTFDDPLTVDFHREKNTHIAFASGLHRCLGSHLARLELRVALEALHARLPDYEIEPGHTVEFSHNPRTPINGLPIVWS